MSKKITTNNKNFKKELNGTNKIKKQKLLTKKEFNLLVIALLVLVSSLINLIIFNVQNNDKVNVYYRTYTKENGWSAWVKNGETSGNGKDSILNIEMKLKTKKNGKIIYNVFQNGKWSNFFDERKLKNGSISGIKASLLNDVRKEYNVYYRTYNKTNKWLEWTSNGKVSGNIKEKITKVQIKALLDDSSLEDYLKDYGEKEIKNKGFEKVGDVNEE